MSASNNTVRVYQCDTWEAFCRKVRQNRFDAARLFRGQSDPTWKLSSVWERWLGDEKKGHKQARPSDLPWNEMYGPIREGYLSRFKELCAGLPGIRSSELTENEWWAIGRHHGLTTPLLDWSRSPYVAAYFAMLDHVEKSNPGYSKGTHRPPLFSLPGTIIVWEFGFAAETTIDKEFDVFTSRADCAFRQRAQEGVFTRLTHDEFMDLESYLASRDSAHLLGRYEIDASESWKALCDLQLMGINPGTMFPDLDGAAAMANIGRRFEHHGQCFADIDLDD